MGVTQSTPAEYTIFKGRMGGYEVFVKHEGRLIYCGYRRDLRGAQILAGKARRDPAKYFYFRYHTSSL